MTRIRMYRVVSVCLCERSLKVSMPEMQVLAATPSADIFAELSRMTTT